MKYLWIGLLLAGFAGAEFLHELWRSEAPGLVCVAPEGRDQALRDILVHHLGSH